MQNAECIIMVEFRYGEILHYKFIFKLLKRLKSLSNALKDQKSFGIFNK
jgi:hypothetical protein